MNYDTFSFLLLFSDKSIGEVDQKCYGIVIGGIEELTYQVEAQGCS